VHIGNSAAISGVSRFLETPMLFSFNSHTQTWNITHYIYSKEENLTLQALTQGGWDVLLSEPTVCIPHCEHWEGYTLIKTIDGFRYVDPRGALRELLKSFNPASALKSLFASSPEVMVLLKGFSSLPHP
jgi:hypothetical protein